MAVFTTNGPSQRIEQHRKSALSRDMTCVQDRIQLVLYSEDAIDFAAEIGFIQAK